jgi:hypothetical protein
VLGGSLIFQRIASSRYLRKNQKQRTSLFWLFENSRIKRTAGSRYFKTLEGQPLVMNELPIRCWFFDIIFYQGEYCQNSIFQVSAGGSIPNFGLAGYYI